MSNKHTVTVWPQSLINRRILSNWILAADVARQSRRVGIDKRASWKASREDPPSENENLKSWKKIELTKTTTRAAKFCISSTSLHFHAFERLTFWNFLKLKKNKDILIWLLSFRKKFRSFINFIYSHTGPFPSKYCKKLRAYSSFNANESDVAWVVRQFCMTQL